MTLTTAEASTFVLTPDHKRAAASYHDVPGLTYKGENQFTANFLSRRHHPPPHDRARLHPRQLAPGEPPPCVRSPCPGMSCAPCLPLWTGY